MVGETVIVGAIGKVFISNVVCVLVFEFPNASVNASSFTLMVMEAVSQLGGVYSIVKVVLVTAVSEEVKLPPPLIVISVCSNKLVVGVSVNVNVIVAVSEIKSVEEDVVMLTSGAAVSKEINVFVAVEFFTFELFVNFSAPMVSVAVPVEFVGGVYTNS